MHVTVVSSSLDPWTVPGRSDWCGRAGHLRQAVMMLDEAGIRSEAVVPGGADSVESGVPAHRVRVDPAGDPGATVEMLTRRLRALWRDGLPDVVHAHHWTAALAARQAAGSARLPLLLTVFASERESAGDRAAMQRAMKRDADRVLVTGSADHRALLGDGVVPERLDIRPIAVDVDVFRPDGPALRPVDHPRLVTIDGLDPGSGAGHAITALSGVPGAELLVAGGRPAGEPDPDRDRLFALATRHGVAGRVRFVGPVARADVPRLLRSADVVVCAAPKWSAGTAALEAMACGRAVVASSAGPQADVVVDQVSGLVVAPRDDRALLRAVRETLEHRCRREAFGIAGRNRAVAMYDRSAAGGALLAAHRVAAGMRSGESAAAS
ncbi:glycosyltransferase family 4 protein [Pseudonocardia parietis]|uniref:Glycosyltransferase involved in cell wall biosynthesis n=1 Tax=Pseudonocardia parietis TaxID=570936 RepID=A0ABS4VVH7_9PSEU|nr:glycosyltransferase family 4 protein [Pseudonocardia parietis]MBP2367911.1 glycosyltransferase involved in cell wall biosynthesis [Pseudonocardia parietis]